MEELNPEQLKVVTTTEGALLVLAGAGSGKTKSIIFRTAYLINHLKVRPWNLLVVTFTNKAAKELKNRLENTFNIYTHNLWIGTFHSICTRILRREKDFLPFNANFSIYDAADQKNVFKKVFKALDIDTKRFPINQVINNISKQKNSLIRAEDFFLFNEQNYYTEIVEKVYRQYQKTLLENNSLDFDDLLLFTAFLFDENESLIEKYANLFKYVMVDEYQDTNYAQFKIINYIAKRHGNICVVGDDDQAIYSWRGANIKNILNFEKDYKNVVKIKLEQNYRSTENILNLANSLIQNNSQRFEKNLWSNIKSNLMPDLMVVENEHDEAKFVADELLKLKLEENINFVNSVILYRTNAQSRVFEKIFVNKNIKYQIVGGVNFYQRKEIKDIIAYLRILVNPQDNESLLRIINFPTRGIGKKTEQRLLDRAVALEINLFTAISSLPKEKDSKQFSPKIIKFAEQLSSWQIISKENTIIYLIEQILADTGILKKYENSDDIQDISRSENLYEFMTAASEFTEQFEEDFQRKPELSDFLQSITLHTDLDSYNENADSVKLMTMHNAKGLEFENVFVVGLEDGLLPHSRSLENDNAMEEERRLLYVAITRAKKRLVLTYTRFRRIYDFAEPTFPSRFLSELDEKYINKISAHFYDFQAPRHKQRAKKNVVLESKKCFRIGQTVNHIKFGKGKILSVEGDGKEAKLTISFSTGMLKKIMGNFIELI
ncbi:MAG: UvrD-helicase domain-containing protein [Candidatus Cloacimonetes bacterium]|nr:UvrD-helicase domain-containing protein [Candidatus Cloacimonadota bacterium]